MSATPADRRVRRPRRHPAVALDTGFPDALTQLGLTPGVIGGATLDASTGTVTFPITGGTVTLYDRETGYRPWVQGVLFHEGSGLSLTAGATTVQLTDFTVDPGSPPGCSATSRSTASSPPPAPRCSTWTAAR